MAYTKQTWSDLEGTGLNKYSIADSGNKKALTWNPDSITNAGTAVTAERMNHIENGIYTADANASEALEKATDNESDIGGLTTRVSNVETGKASVAISTTVSLATASWSASGSLYTQAVTVSGLLATDVPFCQAVCDDETDAEAWGAIIKATPTADTLTFTATEAPSVDLDIQVVVIR